GGAAGSAGAGGAGGPTAPNVLGCKIWLPSDPTWRVGGDARVEATRIVLTPPDASPRLRWGQAYLPFLIGVPSELEVAFTFAFEPGGAGDAYALGASLWFATPSDPFTPSDQTFDVTLGVPGAGAGVALALDMRAAAPPGLGPAWQLYTNRFFDGRTLGGFVAEGEIAGSSALTSAGPAAGPHTTIVRIRREPDAGNDNVAIDATFVSPAGTPTLAVTFFDGEQEALSGNYLGFGAGTADGAGAAHALLGVEIKVDGTCRDQP
ncbi:MAG TPA: hypothetical protein VFS43_32225, partial [Polyangiaceae bacterium]|nr:hypothetical protein [Polyangiaceae bacterium]